MMSRARLRFYAELNDFLRPEQRGKEVEREFIHKAPARDLIESSGVPHPEVGLVVVNGEPSRMTVLLRDGDHVSVYPVFRSLELSALEEAYPARPGVIRFVLDVHLGRLAAYLRMLGFDCDYSNHAADPELAEIAGRDERVLLTRDRYLLMRSEVKWGYLLRSHDPKEQLREIVRRFNIADEMRPFSRCMECNGMLDPVSKASVLDRLPGRIKELDLFRMCRGCGKIYWQGTHWARMNALIAAVSNQDGRSESSESRGE